MTRNMTAELVKIQTKIQAGQLKEAEQAYLRLHKANPRNPDVLAGLVTYYSRFALQFGNAVKAAQLLLRLLPRDGRAHLLAAEAFGNAGRLKEAIKSSRIALKAAPENPDVLFVAATVAMRASLFEDAKNYVAKSLSIRPDHWPTRLQNARLHLSTGDIDEARAIARKLWQDKPDDLNGLDVLVTVETLTQDDPARIHLETQIIPTLKTRGGPVYAKALNILGRAQEASGDYVESFDSFTQSKKARPTPRDEAGYAAFVETLTSELRAGDFEKQLGESSTQPLLIVGMPRCGSTLLEQMLTQHADVASCGESAALNFIVRDMQIAQHDGPAACAAIRLIDEDHAKALGQRYLSETRTRSGQPQARVIIDKALHNFELLGVFAAILPQARIIDMRRDPMDTCVSCYTQQLSSWHNYTHDIGLLGRTYLQYHKLMQHWTRVLPNPMLRVRYEDLVATPEAELRRIIDFADLTWDPNCLSFAQSKNPVTTLSAAQVRQPLYKGSMRRWMRYGDRVDPLKEALAPLYPDGFDANQVPDA